MGATETVCSLQRESDHYDNHSPTGPSQAEVAAGVNGSEAAVARPGVEPQGSSFPPIADYGFLSDCENNCLVAPDGSVEWLCLPRPDSPSVFGAILDRTAGLFRFGPSTTHVPQQRRYLPGTMVLETTWHTPTGWLIVQDLLVVRPVARVSAPLGLSPRPGGLGRHRHPVAPGPLHRGPGGGAGQCGAAVRVRLAHRDLGLRRRGLRDHDRAPAGRASRR